MLSIAAKDAFNNRREIGCGHVAKQFASGPLVNTKTAAYKQMVAFDLFGLVLIRRQFCRRGGAFDTEHGHLDLGANQTDVTDVMLSA